MTQEDVVRMMKKAGFYFGKDDVFTPEWVLFAAIVAESTGIEQQREIVRLKAIIEEQANGAQNLVLAEREACAKVCAQLMTPWDENTPNHEIIALRNDSMRQCAAAIRARGEK